MYTNETYHEELARQKLEADVDTHIQRGDRHAAMFAQAQLLRDSIQPVEMPADMRVWQASQVPMTNGTPNHFQRLNAQHRDFGNPTETMYTLRQREEVAIVRRAVTQMGHYAYADNTPYGHASWRTIEGDLHAVNLDTQRPHTERTARALVALETAGYQNSEDVPVPTPFSDNNPHHNAMAWQAMRAA